MTAEEQTSFTELFGSISMGLPSFTGTIYKTFEELESDSPDKDKCRNNIIKHLAEIEIYNNKYKELKRLFTKYPEKIDSVSPTIAMMAALGDIEIKLKSQLEGLSKKNQHPGLDISDNVQVRDIVWLIAALHEKGWLKKMPTDHELPLLFLKDGESAFKKSSFADSPVKNWIKDKEIDKKTEKDEKLFRDFLRSFPMPIGRLYEKNKDQD